MQHPRIPMLGRLGGILARAAALAAIATAAAQAQAQAQAQAPAPTKWDLPTAYAATNFHTVNIQAFAEDVDKATAGRVKITVHPNASLYKAPEIKRAVQSERVQAGEILLANFENEWPMFGADALPFLAGSYDAAERLYRIQRPLLDKKLAEQGMALLFSVAWTPNGLYTKKPIQTLADMKGVKFRSYSPATSRFGELVGAQPVTVQVAEVSQAFATGVVDSMMSSPVVGVDTKLYEHTKYFYELEAWVPRNAVIVNKRAFDALGKADQAAVAAAAAAAESRGWIAARKAYADALARLKAGGMEIVPPSPELKAQLVKVGAVIVSEWVAKAGADGKALVDELRK